MSDPNTILLIGEGRTKEALANAAINPGHLVELMSTGLVRANTQSGFRVPYTFAIEKDYLGKGVTTAYAANDQVQYIIAEGGDEVAAKLAASAAAIVVGDRLTPYNDGTLRKAVATAIGIMKHDASASSNGVAIYFHADEISEHGTPVGHIESVTAGNADTYFDIGVNGPRVIVRDDDAAATGGYQIYYNQAAGKFYAAIPDLKDAFVLSSSGQAIRIHYAATPSSGNLAVYCDDDAATVSQRLLFVSATTSNGAFYSSADVGMAYDNAIAIALEAVDNSANASTEAFIRVQLI